MHFLIMTILFQFSGLFRSFWSLFRLALCTTSRHYKALLHFQRLRFSELGSQIGREAGAAFKRIEERKKQKRKKEEKEEKREPKHA